MWKKVIASKNDEGRKIFNYLKKILNNVPLSKIEKIFRKGDVKINQKRIRDKNYLVKNNDEIEIFNVSFTSKKIITSQKREFTVIYEDENILIINKNHNVMMHDHQNSLNNQIFGYLDFTEKNTSFEPSSIGRIDKNTSGIVVYCKKYFALKHLKEIQSNFEKIYLFKSRLNKNINFKGKIYYHEKLKKMICNNKKGKDIATNFVIKNNQKIAILETGRKHQIRAILGFLKVPIIGDLKYGNIKATRMYLHSYKIKFKNITNEKLLYLNDQTFTSKINW